MKRYPKYKETGVPWLGQVPAHWEVKRLKRVFSETREKAIQGDEQLAATQKYGVVSQAQFMKDQDQKLVLAMKGTENFKHVERDDFVISLRAFEGGIERSSQSGCVSPAYTVLRSKGAASPAFAARLLKTPEFISQISMTYDGIREGKAIKFKDAGPVSLPIPPLTEQAGIAIFLDGVLDQMDSAITSQERMIELLKERRSAIITQAVTKGLDPKAKMKDSGVPWLGQVPAHWEVKRGRFMFKVNGGFGLKSGKLECAEVQFLPMEKIGERNDLNLDTLRVVDDKANSYVECLEGDVIVAKVTPCFENCKGAVARGLTGGAALATSEVHTLRPYEASADFVYYSTLSGLYRQAGAAEMYGVGGLRRVPPLFFKDARLAVPSAVEQMEIVAHLNDSISKMDSAITSQERMIELLKERRSAIITQAVTGQIDVR